MQCSTPTHGSPCISCPATAAFFLSPSRHSSHPRRGTQAPRADVARLEKDAIGSLRKANNVALLIDCISDAGCSVATRIQACMALGRVYGHMTSRGYVAFDSGGDPGSVNGGDKIPRKRRRAGNGSASGPGPIDSGSSDNADGAARLRAWLAAQFSKALDAIQTHCVRSSDPRVQAAGVHSVFMLVRAQAGALSSLSKSVLADEVTRALSAPSLAPATLDHIRDKILAYPDAAFFALRAIRDALSRPKRGAEDSTDRANVTAPPPSPELLTHAAALLLRASRGSVGELPTLWFAGTSSGGPAASRKRKAPDTPPAESPLHMSIAELTARVPQLLSESWLALFSNTLPVHVYAACLACMRCAILPRISEPMLLFDFLKDSYDVGGMTSVLALEGLFNLIQKRNLDYPDFFGKLYRLLTPGNLREAARGWRPILGASADLILPFLDERSREGGRGLFFKLVHTFLRGSKLPAYMVAAFCKRLLRTGLRGDAALCSFALALAADLIKRNPQCEVLIHRAPKRLTGVAYLGLKPFGKPDPFDETQDDMKLCGALDSCLWEIRAMTNHFCPKVATLAKAFSDPNAPTQPAGVEAELDDSYSSFVDKEAGFQKKAAAALNYKIAENLEFDDEDL